MFKISNNISRDVLLGKGYFPKELPPTFKTADFGRHSKEILQDWLASKIFKYEAVKKKANAFKISVPITECEVISAPKHGYARRPISIVHPISQAVLANEIGENWRTISKWLQRQAFSNDKVRISERYVRGVSALEFKLHQAKISFIEGTADWVAKADISRFYHSIYTHSLAWAAYGKNEYKSDPKKYTGSLADRLDLLIRSCNRNQTIGIPVGPETSRILADIISTRIDEEILSQTNVSPNNIDRLQDDWFVGTNNLEDADRMISLIIATYRQYELDINGEKTSVDRIKTHFAEDWVLEIMAFLSHRPGELSGQRLRAFLSLILKLQKQNEKSSVVSYGISVLESDKFSRADIESVESFLLKCASVSVRAMDRICALLVNLNHETKSLSKKRIGERLSDLAIRNLQQGHQFEAAWQIFAMRGMNFVITSKDIIELGSEVSTSVIPLILLDMKSKQLCAVKLPLAEWERRTTRDTCETSPSWLLNYEGIRNGWLGDPNNLAQHRFFEPMLR